MRTACEFHTAFLFGLAAGLLILFIAKLNADLDLGLDGELWLFTGRFVAVLMIALLCAATICHGYLIRKIIEEERADGIRQ